MDLELRDKRALVTGSTGGIGASIARALAAEGARVVVHGRRRESGERLIREIEESGETARLVLGDLTDDGEAARVAAEAEAAFGGIDVLVNNVGEAPDDGWDDPDPARWVGAYDLNVVSSVRLIKALLPPMRARGWGRIVGLSSLAAKNPLPEYAAYGAAKAALLNLTVGLARGLAGTGVTANAVSPGVILSPEIRAWIEATAREEGWPGGWEEHEARFTSGFRPNAVGRLGRPEEVARVVAFLASPSSGYLNGVDVPVDGGLLR